MFDYRLKSFISPHTCTQTLSAWLIFTIFCFIAAWLTRSSDWQMYDLTLQLSDVAAVPLYWMCPTPPVKQMAAKAQYLNVWMYCVYNFKVKHWIILNNCSVDLFNLLQLPTAANLLFSQTVCVSYTWVTSWIEACFLVDTYFTSDNMTMF